MRGLAQLQRAVEQLFRLTALQMWYRVGQAGGRLSTVKRCQLG